MRKRVVLLIIPLILFVGNLFLMRFTVVSEYDTIASPWIYDASRDVYQKSNTTLVSSTVLKLRQESVREAYKFAFKNYKAYAWPHDELQPNTKSNFDWLGMALSIVDSLDTMYLMQLKDEFQASRDWIEENLVFNKNSLEISVFETTIRVVGGLLSIYDLTGDKLFLTKAQEIGDLLMPAFDSPTGYPWTSIVLKNGKTDARGWITKVSYLAEIGSTQMEFPTLSKLTGNSEYAEKSLKVFDMLDKMQKPDGLYPINIDIKSGEYQSTNSWFDSKWHDFWTGDKAGIISIGGKADSFFEYLLKVWILTGKTNEQYRRMYNEATDAIIAHLVKVSEPSRLVFFTLKEGSNNINNMDHLSCFAGAMFALGAYHNITDEPEKHMQLGIEITKTCHEFYVRMPTGVAPDTVHFQGQHDFIADSTNYLLRPETVESYYVLYWITGDPIYLEWAWDAFTAIEEYCKTNNGYAGLMDVTNTKGKRDNIQQSYFLAETLKYLYLIFSPRDTISLDEWVFNTEAHPLKVW